jgi:hypothetical protein
MRLSYTWDGNNVYIGKLPVVRVIDPVPGLARDNEFIVKDMVRDGRKYVVQSRKEANELAQKLAMSVIWDLENTLTEEK